MLDFETSHSLVSVASACTTCGETAPVVEQGGTVRAGGSLVRRRPTLAEVWVRERQPELFA